MPILDRFRNSKTLRMPLLSMSRWLFSVLKTGPALLRRAVYDAMPVPYLVTGHQEQYVVSTADNVIGRELFLHGQFDFEKLQVALNIMECEGYIRPAHLIDVGANIGTITIPALNRDLMRTATAIEPHPDNLRLLRANLALNGIDNRVTVLAQAVGDTADTQLFLHESNTNSGNHSIGNDGIAVLSSRLDDLSFPPDSLLWMDIEGYEGHALSGATRLLATRIPVVSEFNPDFLMKSGGFEVFQKTLSGRRFYDLQHPNPHSTTLGAIVSELASRPKHLRWTDILAIL